MEPLRLVRREHLRGLLYGTLKNFVLERRTNIFRGLNCARQSAERKCFLCEYYFPGTGNGAYETPFYTD